MAIELEQVGKTFRSARGEADVLRDVDLSVEAGRIVALVGRSGSGKSTLLKLVAGLARPSAGRVLANGQPVSRPPQGVRYVFQDYSNSLFPWLTVGANIRFGLRHGDGQFRRSETQARVQELLGAVGLQPEVARQWPAHLSGGMQQRVAIARALAAEPGVLLMDEPFGAVDELNRATLQDLLLRIAAERRLTVLLVTHDIEEAIYLADRVVVLGEGAEGLIGDLEVSLARPRHQLDTREDPAFLALRRELVELVLAREATPIGAGDARP
ncbi:ABC transporter ATP-binding protein [Conexibacter sp. CPCC 206217]|uniref:ABC transporter ATP-binding protein n=1 Tax=Conexibacter sp. CPCC 206217 TaxID=3064574 RepID=UPI0027272780|nr:ABC transporter ATP-binding protein [Conexibacter sp. CPCC 206217]MDO8208814.1 ABC transporter ATP-binding protein [Conexibacter sp. CPCC 206217]